MKYQKIALAALLASGAMLGSSYTHALELDSSFNVKLAVSPMCTLDTVNDVDFGTVDMNSASLGNLNQNTQLNIQCNKDTQFSVALVPSDNDPNGNGTMTNNETGDTIKYTLYQDAALSQPWGSVVGTNAPTLTSTGAPNKLTVYAMVASTELGPQHSGGHYNDIVAVNIKY